MSKPSDPAPTISEVIDRIEAMREELLAIQRSLEVLEHAQTKPQDDLEINSRVR
jgi:hypothetical protein